MWWERADNEPETGREEEPEPGREVEPEPGRTGCVGCCSRCGGTSASNHHAPLVSSLASVASGATAGAHAAGSRFDSALRAAAVAAEPVRTCAVQKGFGTSTTVPEMRGERVVADVGRDTGLDAGRDGGFEAGWIGWMGTAFGAALSSVLSSPASDVWSHRARPCARLVTYAARAESCAFVGDEMGADDGRAPM